MKRWISWILAVVIILSGSPVQIVAAETIEIESITLDRTEMEIPEGVDVEDVGDWISDQTGFCHYGFELEE